MAARSSLRLLQNLRLRVPAQARGLGTRAAGTKKAAAPIVAGSLAAALAGYGVYKYSSKEAMQEVREAVESMVPNVSAASGPTAQPSVFSPGKNHALYLWIDLAPGANAKEVGKAMARLQRLVEEVSPAKTSDEEDEILAGVGFGPTFYKQLGGNAKTDYVYAHRKGNLGDMPSSPGDVFVHAKCNTPSKLFELAQKVMQALPAGSVRDFEDIYSFVFQNGRDLSGFIDGTENTADEDDRREVAVEKDTGGSYVITQKWLHDLNVISKEKDKTLEGWVGRSRPDSIEINRKSISSHVARMTGGNSFNQPKPFQIVRQSMPFGTLKDGAGLFFIGYAATPEAHNFMLDMMVGAGKDPHCDDIMRFSKNIKGTYWYFPGVEQLKKLE